jgi:hypothetical protein
MDNESMYNHIVYEEYPVWGWRKKMYCVKCGAIVADDQFYCNKCARSAAAESSVPAAAAIGPETFQPESGPFPAQENGESGPAGPEIKLDLSQGNTLSALNAKLSEFRKGMLVNGAICIGGALITVLTYSAASTGGGRYFVFWGAVIYGGVQCIRSTYYYFKTKSMIRKLSQQ